MNDYIFRQDAIRAIAEQAMFEATLDSPYACDVVEEWDEYGRDVLEGVPSADVVEHKYGEWMPIIDANELGEPYQCGIYCSECGFQTVILSNFCPECGADMRGDNNEVD